MKKDIVVTRIFNAPVAMVWKTWTDPGLIKRWWGPDWFTCPSAKIDFREGGTSIVCMRSPPEFAGGRDFYNSWVYQRIIPMQSIDFLQSLSDQDGNKIDPQTVGMPPDFPAHIRTLVNFRDLGKGRTEMIVTEFDWNPGQMSEFAKTGLEQSLDKMLGIFGNE